jgi:hypothetical protein
MWDFMNLERFILWIALGVFICYKRDWYERGSTEDFPSGLVCFFATVFMPINFIIVFFRMFFINKWNNE